MLRNANSMPFPVYGVFCLTTFSFVHDSEFKYSKRVFTRSRLKQVLCQTHVRQPSYSDFFTDQLNVNILLRRGETERKTDKQREGDLQGGYRSYWPSRLGCR